MNRLRKLAWSGLGLAAVILAGCQTGSDSGSSGTPTASTTGSAPKSGKKFKVGVSIPAADHGWTAGVKYWAKQATDQNPDIDWVIQDAKEPNEQINSLENFKTQGVDAVVILATESAPLTPEAEKLHEAGILIINVDRGFTKPVADVFIQGDNKAFGKKSAEFMAAKLGGKGNIAILEGIPSTVNTDRVSSAMEVFKANPGIHVVAQDSGQWNREKAEKVVQNMLAANPKIDAIWASDDDMALGAETALKAAGRDKNIWMLGGAGMKDIVKRVGDKDPLFPADITYPPSMIAFGIQTAAGMLRAGKDNAKQYTPKNIRLDVDLVTPDNYKDYYFPDSIY
jgi:ribose transport system substrate-binding protein